MTHSKLHAWVLLLLGLSLSLTARAEEVDLEAVRPFVFFSMGTASTPDLTDATSVNDERVATANATDATVGGGVGFFYWYTRQELRVDHHRADVESLSEGVGISGAEPAGDRVSVTTILYKLYLRYPFLDERVALNAGGGFGAAHGRIPLRGLEIDDWQLAYTGGAGMFVDLWRGIGVDMGYRYVGATDFEGSFPNPAPSNPFDTTIDHDFGWGAHEFVVSLQYGW